MAKSKVKSSSSKNFISPGGKVTVKHPASATKPAGKGMGTPGGNVGKQSAKAARPA